jgi:hypothetical protein
MNSEAPGSSTLNAEVTHISNNGFWLLSQGKEHFLSFEEFPWFKNASIGNILKIEEQTTGHFYWPELDVDLSIDIIEHPANYPLSFE